MCSSDKQNMGGIRITNVVKLLFESLKKANPTSDPKVKDIKQGRAELKDLVEKARRVIDNKERLDLTFIGNLIDAEYYRDAIDYLFHNNLLEGQDLKQIKRYLDMLIKQLKDPNQSSGSNIINIQPGNVRRCLLILYWFPEHLVFNLKRVTRLSVPNEVIPKNLEKLSEFLDNIGEPLNHYHLNANGRKEVKKFPEWDRKSFLKGIKCEQNINSYPSLNFEFYGTKFNDLPNFQQWEYIFLRYLSLRGVIMEGRENIDLNKLSSLRYLDLKHTNVKNCDCFIRLEKLQMLDLRYTNVKEISGNDLEKLGELQHLLLGYQCEKNGKKQLVGPKLIEGEKKLKTTTLKTLRAIEQPEEISHFSSVVDLSVTGLTEESLPAFWVSLENFHKLTSLGVAVTDPAVIIKLEECGVELKKKLKRLRMEGSYSGLEEQGEFKVLNDLTLTKMDFGKILELPKLLCLRLCGVCQKTTCEINLNGCPNLKKLVIGDMGEVERVQICSAVFQTVATLKFSNLERLKEVVYTDKQPSDEWHSLLRWANIKEQECSGEVKPNKTIFLRNSGNFPVEKSNGLEIYHYDEYMQCYKLNAA